MSQAVIEIASNINSLEIRVSKVNILNQFRSFNNRKLNVRYYLDLLFYSFKTNISLIDLSSYLFRTIKDYFNSIRIIVIIYSRYNKY